VLDLLLVHVGWLCILWMVLAVFDYGSTIWLEGAYRTTLGRHVVYEGGLELNPRFEQDVARRRTLSPRFVGGVAVVVALLVGSSFVGRIVTEFLAGWLFMTWLFIDMRHLTNYARAGLLRRRPDAATGQVVYSRWLTQRTFSAEAAVFGLLCVALALLTLRLFFLAGSLGLLGLALRHYRLADRGQSAHDEARNGSGKS
jgi:hypothetical protein